MWWECKADPTAHCGSSFAPAAAEASCAITRRGLGEAKWFRPWPNPQTVSGKGRGWIAIPSGIASTLPSQRVAWFPMRKVAPPIPHPTPNCPLLRPRNANRHMQKRRRENANNGKTSISLLNLSSLVAQNESKFSHLSVVFFGVHCRAGDAGCPLKFPVTELPQSNSGQDKCDLLSTGGCSFDPVQIRMFCKFLIQNHFFLFPNLFREDPRCC